VDLDFCIKLGMRFMNIKKIKDLVIGLGAKKAEIINVSDILFDTSFRKMCEMNSCGMYGTNWTCPPDIGEINDLIEEAKAFDLAIVYQTISKIEDSYDIEGMLEAGERQNKLALKIKREMGKIPHISSLNLGAGGCKICKTCAKLANKPCVFPDLAIPSLEAYGISVYDLAQTSGMNYINGVNTVTYFGVLLVKEGNKPANKKATAQGS